MNFERKVNVIRSGYSTPMEIKIRDKQLGIIINGEIMFIDLCRYLIEHTPILQIEYHRTCPYKLRVEKIHENGTFNRREYHIDYLEVKNNLIEEKTSHIINLNGCNTKVSGEIECFIPDLLLVLQERGYVQGLFADASKFIVTRKFATEVIYVDTYSLVAPDNLKRQGYTVPIAYEYTYSKTLK